MTMYVCHKIYSSTKYKFWKQIFQELAYLHMYVRMSNTTICDVILNKYQYHDLCYIVPYSTKF